MSSLQKIPLTIHGMHCASCEVMIERRFKKIPGVEKVNVNHATGKADVYCTIAPKITEFQNAIQDQKYTVLSSDETSENAHEKTTKKDVVELGAIFLIIMGVYVILKALKVLPEGFGVTENMSYGFVFVLGLVAAMSTCIAVTGGLLLAVAAKYNERYPNLSGAQKFRPHLYFNLGRIVSYTLLGGLVGSLGSVLTLSTKTTGVITVAASIVMVILGFQLLKLFPQLKRFQPKMPKFLAHKIHDATDSKSKFGPFMLGGATFFLPCGFTQALQLYVLSQGDFKTGALTMFAFSLGTLPALMSLSAISSFARGSFQKYFVKFAGVIVILLGLSNINNGLALTGNAISFGGTESDVAGTSTQNSPTTDPNVQLVNGVQVVNMQVDGYEYTPANFTVQQGVPVEWQIDGRNAAGCAQVITLPALGITKYLSQQGITPITFTPTQTGTLSFSCTMGMTTRGAGFRVVPKNATTPSAQQAPTPKVLGSADTQEDTETPTCDPTIAHCLTPQKISMEVSRERGFYPGSFTVQKGLPVELIVDAKVQLRGCMGTMVIPDLDLAKPIPLGKTTFRFTPTQTGILPITCSMGNRLASIQVVDRPVNQPSN